MNGVVTDPPNGIVHLEGSQVAPPDRISGGANEALMADVAVVAPPDAKTVSLSDVTVAVLCEVCTVLLISNSHEYASPTVIGVLQSFNTDTPNNAAPAGTEATNTDAPNASIVTAHVAIAFEITERPIAVPP